MLLTGGFKTASFLVARSTMLLRNCRKGGASPAAGRVSTIAGFIGKPHITMNPRRS
jgi:hypothetical protein